jgi:uncharacterized protein Smg (DUF494 family)
MRRLSNYAVLAVVALLATACTLTQLAYSNISLAYNNAPPMLAWMVGDYVDMSDEQKEFVRERFGRAFAWHRQQQLPEYKRFLEKVIAQAEDQITLEEAASDHRQLRAYYQRAVERLLPDMADFLLGLDSLQARQMEKRFAKDNRKMVKDATDSDGDDRLDRRVDRFVTHLEQFLGSVSEEQRRMVAGYMSAQSELLEERLADRRYRQAAVLEILKTKPPREQVVAELRRLFIDMESWRDPAYQRKLRGRDQALFDLISRLSVSATAEQRAAFQMRLRGFMRDIGAITASS